MIHYLEVPLDEALRRLAARNLERPPGTHQLGIDEARSFFEEYFEPPHINEGLELVIERVT